MAGRHEAPASGLQRLLRPVDLGEPTTSSMASRGALGLLSTGSQGILRFATSLLIGNIAGKALLGTFQTALSLSLLLALMWPTSTGTAASTYIARTRGAGDLDETRAVAAHLARRTLLSAGLLAAVGASVWVLGMGRTFAGALAVMAALLGYSGYSFTRGVQYGSGQLWRGTMWDVISASLGLATIAVLLVAGVRDLWLLAALGGAYGLYTLACWPHGAHGTLSRERRRELDTFVALGVAGSIASAGFLQLTQLVVDRVSTGHTGDWAAAMALATPTSLLAGTLSLVLVPAMAEAWGRGDRAGFTAATDRATRALVVLMVAAFGALAIGSRTLILVLFHKAPDAATLLPVLLFAVLGTTLGVACVNAQMTSSMRGNALTSTASAAGMILGSLSWVVLVPRLGVVGVAWGYLVGTWTISLIPILATWRQFGHRWGLLAARLIVGVAVAGGLARAALVHEWGVVAQLAAAVAFVVGWFALSLPDLRALRALAARRGAPAPRTEP